ncbi:MAG: phosphatase PAP2 family protein [Eggerthellaceae bacterium]|nr:phosphatase PAP2 family protein [Eggerthellaceae bacterium]
MSAKQLKILDKILTGIGYIAYPALLIYLLIIQSPLLLACIIVPALCFASTSALRYLINAARPYETGTSENLLDKKTQGKSFPSRHVSSMFAIAASWLLVNEAIGAILCILGCIMAAVRVRGGAHSTKDVIAGAVFAFAFCAIGYAMAYQLI